MKAARILVLTLLMPLPAWAAAPDPQHYRLCLNASSNNPSAALIDAETWARQGGGVPAQHCAALALVSLKRYGEAGTRLDKLAAAKDLPDASFRTELFDQAGNAWLLAGDGARAVQSFSAALTPALRPAEALEASAVPAAPHLPPRTVRRITASSL